MLSRLFTIPDTISQDKCQSGVLERYFSRENGSKKANKLLVNGPHSCGKTSLLFSLAVSFAEEGKHVLFLSPRKLHKLPAFPQGKQRPLTHVLQRIRMVYLENCNELLKYLASIHIGFDEANAVHCMVIDHLDFYITNDGQKNEDLTKLARIMAYAIEAYEFIQRESAVSCVLAISTVYIKPNLYDRWMDHILRITVNKDSKHDGKLYQVSVHQAYSSEVLDIHYNLTDNQYAVTQIVA